MAGKIEKISQREFARRDGCDPKLVRIAIEDGHLETLPGGGLDAALVGTEWRKTNRRGGEKVGKVRSKVGSVPTKVRKVAIAKVRTSSPSEPPMPDLACNLVAMADAFANDAAVVLLRHLPLATVRPMVVELLKNARQGVIEMLEEDEIMPPPGTSTWSGHRAFTTAVPTEDEWLEAVDEAGRAA